eukprot:s2661_g19.t1
MALEGLRPNLDPVVVSAFQRLYASPLSLQAAFDTEDDCHALLLGFFPDMVEEEVRNSSAELVRWQADNAPAFKRLRADTVGHVKSWTAEISAEAPPRRPAEMYTVAMLLALELTVEDETELVFTRALAWVVLVMVWAALRCDDVQVPQRRGLHWELVSAQLLLPDELESHFSGHSPRNFLTSVAALIGFSKDMRAYLGRWATGMTSSEEYVRTARQVVYKIQRAVNQSIVEGVTEEYFEDEALDSLCKAAENNGANPNRIRRGIQCWGALQAVIVWG